MCILEFEKSHVVVASVAYNTNGRSNSSKTDFDRTIVVPKSRPFSMTALREMTIIRFDMTSRATVNQKVGGVLSQLESMKRNLTLAPPLLSHSNYYIFILIIRKGTDHTYMHMYTW